MTNQVTSIEQSKRLLKLGVPAEKASMKWERYSYCTDQHGEEPITVWDDWSLEIGSISMDANNYQNVPAFTVADLLEMLPDKISCINPFDGYLRIGRNRRLWIIDYDDFSICRKKFIDALVKTIERLLSNWHKLKV